LLTVLHHSPVLPTLFTDCLGLISTLERGMAAAVGHDRPLARLWRLIFTAVDGGVPAECLHKTFVWLPAHRSRQAVGHVQRSDGQLLSLTDWRANRLVDLLAKAAAGRRRIPMSTMKLLADADASVSCAAALLGVVTHAANNFAETSWRADGSAVVVHHRDALPLPYNDARRHQAMRRADAAPRTSARSNKEPSEPLPVAAPMAPAPAGGSAPAAHGRSQAAAVAMRRQEDEVRGVQSWVKDLANRGLQPAPNAGNAQARLEALRQRIAGKSMPAPRCL